MKIRIKAAPFAALIILIALLDALRGLAGPFAAALAFFPLFLSIFSLLHTALSYSYFGFHQDFSTDHPAKGQPIRYSIHLQNHLPLPLSNLRCTFTFAGPGTAKIQDFTPYIGSNSAASREEFLRCAYRGVYAAGAERFIFRDALGIVELEHQVESRVFHVFPELVSLGPGVENLASGGGEGRAVPGSSNIDPGVFKSLVPLSTGRGGHRIAWSRYAASGIPSVLEEGGISSFGLRILLDLRPPLGFIDENDRLAAEDLAISMVFSLLDSLSQLSVPAELVLGSSGIELKINDKAAFEEAYVQSTSILFTDTALPTAIFKDNRALLIVSVRSISDRISTENTDLYEIMESAAHSPVLLHLVTVVPPSRVAMELERVSNARERLQLKDSTGVLFKALDTRSGSEALLQVFSR